MDEFEGWVRHGLGAQGVEADDTDVQIMRYIDKIWGPEMRALVAADLSAVWPEPDLDPGRPPKPVPEP